MKVARILLIALILFGLVACSADDPLTEALYVTELYIDGDQVPAANADNTTFLDGTYNWQTITSANLTDYATIDYVDTAIGSIWEYFFDNVTGTGGYYNMGDPSGEAQSTFTTAGLGAGNGQALDEWITDAAVGFVTVNAGVVHLHIHAEKTAGTKPVTIYAELYERTAVGAETLITTTEVSAAITAAVDVDLHGMIATSYEIDPTSFLVIKLLANVGATGSDATVALYAEGNTSSRIGVSAPGMAGGGGGGDMTKAVYDTGDNAAVDLADEASSAKVLSSATDITVKPSGDTDDYLTITTTGGVPTIASTGAPLDVQAPGGSITLKPSGDTDDYLTLATVSNIPTIYGTGAYTRFGDAATTSRGFVSEDDVVVTGKFEVDGLAYFDQNVELLTGKKLYVSAASFSALVENAADANAKLTFWQLSTGGATYVPVFVMGTNGSGMSSTDLGLFDGVTQPVLSMLDKVGRYTYDTTYYSDAGAATPIMKKTGNFASSTAGDIVRVTAGTNATPGWYYIVSKDSNDQVTLDRNWCTGNVPNNGNAVIYHSFTALSAEGLLTRVTYGAPTDSSVELDRDGWLILDTSQANGRLYWRANNAWHYVDATAGFSAPEYERIDPNGHEFQVGDTVRLVVDKINDDGSFHALPYYDDRPLLDKATVQAMIDKALAEKEAGKGGVPWGAVPGAVVVGGGIALIARRKRTVSL